MLALGAASPRVAQAYLRACKRSGESLALPGVLHAQVQHSSTDVLYRGVLVVSAQASSDTDAAETLVSKQVFTVRVQHHSSDFSTPFIPTSANSSKARSLSTRLCTQDVITTFVSELGTQQARCRLYRALTLRLLATLAVIGLLTIFLRGWVSALGKQARKAARSAQTLHHALQCVITHHPCLAWCPSQRYQH